MKVEGYHGGEIEGAKEVGARRTHNMKKGWEEGERQWEEGEKQQGEEQQKQILCEKCHHKTQYL